MNRTTALHHHTAFVGGKGDDSCRTQPFLVPSVWCGNIWVPVEIRQQVSDGSGKNTGFRTTPFGAASVGCVRFLGRPRATEPFLRTAFERWPGCECGRRKMRKTGERGSARTPFVAAFGEEERKTAFSLAQRRHHRLLELGAGRIMYLARPVD
jgi:hypothetical protein